MGKPVLVFDLDGTLYGGDSQYRYYAQAVSRFLDDGEARLYLRRVNEHLSGQRIVIKADNWEAVVKLMEPFGQKLSVDEWQQAFRDTREYMLSCECVLEISQDLRALLADIRGQVSLALVTNSPYEAAWPLMERLGLSASFEFVRTEARKPQGLVTMVKEIMNQTYHPEGVFTIGDHYYNDIAPGVREGWTTAHISPRRVFPGPATYQVAKIEELFDSIRSWVRVAGREQAKNCHRKRPQVGEK